VQSVFRFHGLSRDVGGPDFAYTGQLLGGVLRNAFGACARLCRIIALSEWSPCSGLPSWHDSASLTSGGSPLLLNRAWLTTVFISTDRRLWVITAGIIECMYGFRGKSSEWKRCCK
jgi:hypothetical protein